MSANSVEEMKSLGEAPFLSFEVVYNEDDFFVSVNGDCLPTMCSGFSLNEAECLVLRQGPMEFVSLPMPAEFVYLFGASNDVLFVHFLPDKKMDTSFLPRLGLIEEE